MPLCCSHTLDPNISQPFRWSPAGFLYLGIKVSPCLKDLYKLNIAPLLQTIKQDLNRWCGLPLSLLGRIHLIKMNILPRLLYYFSDAQILNLLYISPGRVATLGKDKVILKNMLNIWRKVRKLEGYSNCFSLLTPIHENPDFQPGLRGGLANWKYKGIGVVGDMIQGGSILTFQQAKSKYGITDTDFVKFLQVRNFILCNLKYFTGGLAISPIESLIGK